MAENSNKPIAWRVATVGTCLVVMACGLAACSADDRHSVFAYSDTVVSDVGDSIASNQVAQTVDPWSKASRNKELPLDGNQAHAAVERYKTDSVKTPQGLTGSSGSGQSSGTPAVN